MALIKCEECGQMVSDRAESCPNCGNPIYRREVAPTIPKAESGGSKYKTAAIIMFICGGIALLLNFISLIRAIVVGHMSVLGIAFSLFLSPLLLVAVGFAVVGFIFLRKHKNQKRHC